MPTEDQLDISLESQLEFQPDHTPQTPPPMTPISDNAKRRFAAIIVSMAEYNSQDAEHATEFLKSEGIDVSALIKFIPWLQELHRLYKEATGDPEFRITTKEARKWFDDGFTPYQTFRETFNMENDG